MKFVKDVPTYYNWTSASPTFRDFPVIIAKFHQNVRQLTCTKDIPTYVVPAVCLFPR